LKTLDVRFESHTVAVGKMSEIEIKTASGEELEKWDRIIDACEHGSIFHKLQWLRAAQKHSRTRLLTLVGYKGQEIVGLFPFFYMKKGPLKMFFSPPPGCAIPYLGPVFKDYEKIDKQRKREKTLCDFIGGAIEFIKKTVGKADYVSVYPVGCLTDMRPYIWDGFAVRAAYDYVIELEKSPEELLKNFSADLRTNIKKASEIDAEITEGGKEELLAIHSLLKERYVDQQGIEFSLSSDYLLELYENFADNLKIFAVKKDGEIISGAIKPFYKGRIIDWIGQPKIASGRGVLNDLLHFKAIQWGCENGFKEYLIIGANTKRISDYKAKFNPALQVRFTAEKANAIARLARWGYLLKKFGIRRSK
jgi:hypothetical protein